MIHMHWHDTITFIEGLDICPHLLNTAILSVSVKKNIFALCLIVFLLGNFYNITWHHVDEIEGTHAKKFAFTKQLQVPPNPRLVQTLKTYYYIRRLDLDNENKSYLSAKIEWTNSLKYSSSSLILCVIDQEIPCNILTLTLWQG